MHFLWFVCYCYINLEQLCVFFVRNVRIFVAFHVCLTDVSHMYQQCITLCYVYRPHITLKIMQLTHKALLNHAWFMFYVDVQVLCRVYRDSSEKMTCEKTHFFHFFPLHSHMTNFHPPNMRKMYVVTVCF